MNDSRRASSMRFLPSLVAIHLIGSSCASTPELAPCPPPPVDETASSSDLQNGDIDLQSRDIAAGATLFATECSKCHEPQLAARSRIRHSYPRLDCADYLGGVSDAYLARVIAEGGEAVGLAATMQPFGQRLSTAQISDLIAYIRQTGRSD